MNPIQQIIHEFTLDFMRTQNFKFTSPEEYIAKYREIHAQIEAAYLKSNKQ